MTEWLLFSYIRETFPDRGSGSINYLTKRVKCLLDRLIPISQEKSIIVSK